jgi:hypothetical protein
MAKMSRYHDLYVGFARPIDCWVARWMEDRGIPQCVKVIHAGTLLPLLTIYIR